MNAYHLSGGWVKYEVSKHKCKSFGRQWVIGRLRHNLQMHTVRSSGGSSISQRNRLQTSSARRLEDPVSRYYQESLFTTIAGKYRLEAQERATQQAAEVERLAAKDTNFDREFEITSSRTKLLYVKTLVSLGSVSFSPLRAVKTK
jgi:hypothetical protein